MDKKERKKKEISAILSDAEKVLHDAVEMGIETHLNVYEMLTITFSTLYEKHKKRMARVRKSDGVKNLENTNNVLEFKPKKPEEPKT